MPPLRISDWRNATVGKSNSLNEIDLKKGIMTRRIKKNQKQDTEDIIDLPKSLIQFIKARKIKGDLFPDMSTTQIDTLLKKTFPDKKANPHAFRSIYTVNILSKLTDKEEIIKRLKIMDHSLKINSQYYNKQSTSAYNDLLSGK